LADHHLGRKKFILMAKIINKPHFGFIYIGGIFKFLFKRHTRRTAPQNQKNAPIAKKNQKAAILLKICYERIGKMECMHVLYLHWEQKITEMKIF